LSDGTSIKSAFHWEGAGRLEDIRLAVDLLLALGTAVVCGALAQRIGLPVLIGYIAAGLIIGPNTPGFVADRHQVELLANVGVAFLMFSLGVEFSLSDLLRVRRIALICAGIQLPLTVGLGMLVGRAVGWEWNAAFILGGAFAISSSIVAIKVLIGRGEMQTQQAALTIGISVVQDLSLVVLLALVPTLTAGSESLAPTLARSLITAAIALTAVIVIGTRVVPWILGRVVSTGSKELFLLTVVVIALGTAAAAHAAGLSFALGAFLAGIVVSESDYDVQVSAQFAPLRDLFATLFFIAVGMLLEPQIIFDNLEIVLLLVGALIIGKMILIGGALLATGVDHWTSTRTAIVLAQMGEFSFVLAGVALAEDIIDNDQYGLILTAALGSIIAMPLILIGAPTMTRVAQHLPFVASREERWVPGTDNHRLLSGHVLICGYGRIGSELARSLRARGIDYSVVDINPATIRQLRKDGVTSAFGDAAQEEVLEAAGLHHAQTLAITVPGSVETREILHTARRVNSDITIIARATAADQVDSIASSGANEVVQPEFEAAMEFMRTVLVWHGVNMESAISEIRDRRIAVYGLDSEEARVAPSGGSRVQPEPTIAD